MEGRNDGGRMDRWTLAKKKKEQIAHGSPLSVLLFVKIHLQFEHLRYHPPPPPPPEIKCHSGHLGCVCVCVWVGRGVTP